MIPGGLTREALREQVAVAIHDTVCAATPCTPGAVDWWSAADAALGDIDGQVS